MATVNLVPNLPVLDVGVGLQVRGIIETIDMGRDCAHPVDPGLVRSSAVGFDIRRQITRPFIIRRRVIAGRICRLAGRPLRHPSKGVQNIIYALGFEREKIVIQVSPIGYVLWWGTRLLDERPTCPIIPKAKLPKGNLRGISVGVATIIPKNEAGTGGVFANCTAPEWILVQ